MLEGFRAQFSTKVLVLIPIAAGINLVGGALCSSLKLPLFLDMIGTMVIACLSGPWVAALTGLLTNVFLAIVANPVYLPYAVVSVLCGFVVGVMARIGLFRKPWGIVLIWLTVTVVNAVSRYSYMAVPPVSRGPVYLQRLWWLRSRISLLPCSRRH